MLNLRSYCALVMFFVKSATQRKQVTEHICAHFALVAQTERNRVQNERKMSTYVLNLRSYMCSVALCQKHNSVSLRAQIERKLSIYMCSLCAQFALLTSALLYPFVKRVSAKGGCRMPICLPKRFSAEETLNLKVTVQCSVERVWIPDIRSVFSGFSFYSSGWP